MERIDGVIILGRGVPEQIKDGRVTVCVAGWCQSKGFVRIYPTRIKSPLKVWNIVDIEVERNPKDSRHESWKLPDSRSGWENIDRHIDVVGHFERTRRFELLDSIKSSCVLDINRQRNSLGIIKPVIKRAYLKPNQLYAKAHQPLFEIMEDADVSTKRSYYVEPRLCYVCNPDCRAKDAHDMQLLDWGCYRCIEKNPENPEKIWKNMRLNSPGWNHYFLVGNQSNQRTSYMVINVLFQKGDSYQMSFDDYH